MTHVGLVDKDFLSKNLIWLSGLLGASAILSKDLKSPLEDSSDCPGYHKRWYRLCSQLSQDSISFTFHQNFLTIISVALFMNTKNFSLKLPFKSS